MPTGEPNVIRYSTAYSLISGDNDKEGVYAVFSAPLRLMLLPLLMSRCPFYQSKGSALAFTLKRIEKELVSDSLVYRYALRPGVVAAPDGFI